MSMASIATSRTWTDRGAPPTPAPVASPSPPATSEIRRARATSRPVTEAVAGDWRLRTSWSRRRSIQSRPSASAPQAATTRPARSAASASDPAGRLARSRPRTRRQPRPPTASDASWRRRVRSRSRSGWSTAASYGTGPTAPVGHPPPARGGRSRRVSGVALVALVVLSALAVPLSGGRLGALAELRLRHVWAVYVALGLGVLAIELPGLPDGLRSLLLVAAYPVGAVFLAANWRVPGIVLTALGAALNLLAITANGGVMPMSPAALARAGLA